MDIPLLEIRRISGSFQVQF